jgi:hypothetical protein
MAREDCSVYRLVRIYTGTDGKSHFEDIEIPLKTRAFADLRSSFTKAEGIIFRETTEEYDLDFHPAPHRQYVVTLEGQVDVITGDGTIRRFGPGDVMLAEDTTGQGHISRAVNNRPRKCIFIILD